MCMSKGAPKKPEFGPCQEQHSLTLNDPKVVEEAIRLIGFAVLMAPLINFMKAFCDSTTAATLP